MFCQILFKANFGHCSCQNAVPCLLGIFHTWRPPSHSGNSSHWRIPARHSLHLCGPYSSWYAPVGQGNSSVLECHWCTVLVIWLPSSICILIPSLQAGFAGGLPLVVLVLAHPQFRQTVSYLVMFGPLYRPKAQISTKESRLKTFLKCDICILSAVLAFVSTDFYKGIKVEDISDM